MPSTRKKPAGLLPETKEPVSRPKSGKRNIKKAVEATISEEERPVAIEQQEPPVVEKEEEQEQEQEQVTARPSIWQRITATLNYKVSKTVLVIIAVALAAMVIYNSCRVYKLHKLQQESGKVKAGTDSAKEKVRQIEAGLSEHRNVDSAYWADKERLSQAQKQYDRSQERYEAFHSTLDIENGLLKKQNYEQQKRIRDADTTELNRISRE